MPELPSGALEDPLAVAQLLCTRLCHDLAGPVGAVAAGVELTAGDPAQVDAETLALIGNSSAAASRKLKFLRVAMGLPPALPSGLADMRSLVEGFLQATAGRSGVPALGWPSPADMSAASERIGPQTVPLILNLCLLVVEAQPACRMLGLTVAAGHRVSVTVDGQGDATRIAAWRPDILASIAGTSTAPGAKTIQAHVTAILAARAGGRLTLSAAGPGLAATFDGT